MYRTHRDEGIILKKTLYPDQKVRLQIFSKTTGKLNMTAYGVKKITSRRLAHLETGNLIKFTYSEKEGRLTLQETEIVYTYSKVKNDLNKLKMLYLLFFILQRLLPEEQEEEGVYLHVKQFMKDLNNKKLANQDLETELKWFFLHSGYIDEKTLQSPTFSVNAFTEELLGRKLPNLV